ncbi:hypothetical protein B0J12DRAFT_663557 [Macrophomina phaseolina]|uniref:Uncharacterized protein n=1 Tax=Macrophomina phaseolina TaxID=35725 RepID=A0ABQ8GAS2_9PEZI|nr:hypothetical protein B0J12DRAFT_663557 [Macrophomina phaseolina]
MSFCRIVSIKLRPGVRKSVSYPRVRRVPVYWSTSCAVVGSVMVVSVGHCGVSLQVLRLRLRTVHSCRCYGGFVFVMLLLWISLPGEMADVAGSECALPFEHQFLNCWVRGARTLA